MPARIREEVKPQKSRYKFYDVANGRRTGISVDWPSCAEVTKEHERTEFTGFDRIEDAWAYLQARKVSTSAHPMAGISNMEPHVAAAIPGGAATGSIKSKGLFLERLAGPRLQMIARCIDGKCEGSRVSGERAVMCRAGCGRSLHMLTCAQVGKGYQALGNFTCHFCRLAASMEEGSKPSISFSTRECPQNGSTRANTGSQVYSWFLCRVCEAR